ncbi:MAG: EpsG family protein [Phocaeicola vulgatus]
MFHQNLLRFWVFVHCSFGISSYAFFIYMLSDLFLFSKAVLLSDRNIRFIVVIMILQSLLFFQSFNLVRQILACAIFLYGLMLISCGKKHYIVFVLAFLVHYSALFGILMIVLAKMIKVNIVVLMIYIDPFVFIMGRIYEGFISIFEPIIGKRIMAII